jgi:hypothetical protein
MLMARSLSMVLSRNVAQLFDCIPIHVIVDYFTAFAADIESFTGIATFGFSLEVATFPLVLPIGVREVNLFSNFRAQASELLEALRDIYFHAILLFTIIPDPFSKS